jgi:chromosome segregation ATPase
MENVADDKLDELYFVPPDQFTARRAELAAAAKRRGDKAAAKRISSARRPTTAAWVVNQLVQRNEDARQALSDLGLRLRAAHGAMAGDQIRELSAEQRRLVDELVRAAFESAEVASPTAALRDDVTGTLQAAVADPELAARLGQLTKAERWSGFGEFVDVAPVSEPQPDEAVEAARAAVAEAELAKTTADEELSKQAVHRATAQQRVDRAHDELRDAEAELTAAQSDYDEASQARDDAADRLDEALARLPRS